jgi:4-hydroxybenzoate polyprenyltransferase
MPSRPAGLTPPAAVRTQKSPRPGDDQNPADLRAGRRRRARLRDRAELLRASALFTVPGDALASAPATGEQPDRGTAYAAGASLCLHEAGLALDGWADRDEDAVERLHRPVPSGRISPAAALKATGLPPAAGLTFAARAGRPAADVAPAPTAIWAYDLRLKHTPAAPAATAPAREEHRLRCRTAIMPLDPSPVRGSHCRLPTSDDVRALVLVPTPRAVSGR